MPIKKSSIIKARYLIRVVLISPDWKGTIALCLIITVVTLIGYLEGHCEI